MDEEEGGSVPLVKALKVDHGGTTDDGSMPRRKFKVVAPSSLPKGYRLTVIDSKTNREVVVLIPDGGVKALQSFEGVEARKITERWSDSEFDCDPNYEGCFCWLATCLNPLAWAFIIKQVRMAGCGTEAPWLIGTLLLFYWCVHLLVSDPGVQMCKPFLVIFFTCLATCARGAVRHKYKIPGSCCGDCLCVTFCSCCTLLQSFRHMKRNGDTPFRGCGDGTVKAVQV